MYVLGARLTYAAAFQYAQASLPSGTIFVLANADISFGATLIRLRHPELNLKGRVLTKFF